ncbi:hypothetical protein LCGC14_1504830, partial [marine sediment metagenome]
MPNGEDVTEVEVTEPEFPSPFDKVQELFPGFKNLMISASQIRYRTGREVTRTRSRLDKLMLERETILSTPGVWHPGVRLAAKMALPRIDASIAEAQSLFNLAEDESNRADWRYTVVTIAPYELMDVRSEVRTVDDIRAAYPLAIFDDDDQAWLDDFFSKIEHLAAPTIPVKTPGEAADWLNRVLEPEKLALAPVHSLAVNELIKSFAIPAPDLPPGVTDKDVLAIMTELQFSDVDKQDIEDLHNFVLERREDFAEQSSMQLLLRSGLVDPEATQLTRAQWAWMAMTQPMLATLEGLETYFNALARPLSAWVIAQDPLRGTKYSSGWASELRQLQVDFMAYGEDSWSAWSKAFNESETNVIQKIIIETMFDPTSWIGLGIATKATAKIPHIGRWVGAFEAGWLEMWDTPFRGIRALIKKIPKTPGQASMSYARAAFASTRALVRKVTGKPLSKVTPEEFGTMMQDAIRAARQAPLEIHNPMVQVGSFALEHDFLAQSTMMRWIKELGSKRTYNMQLHHEIEGLFDQWWKRINREQIPGKILEKFELANSDTLLAKAGRMLTEYEDEIVAAATGRFSTDMSAKGMLDDLFKILMDSYMAKLRSPMYKFAKQGGMVTSWSRGVDRIVNNNLINWWDRHITAPMANNYLLFTNYGVFNVAETSMRSFLGGAEVWYPKASSPVDEFVRLGEGLGNFPYEFIEAQTRIGRLETAITVPGSGKTMVFERGRIPGITRELPGFIPEKEIAFPGGVAIGTKGFKLQVGNREYVVRSWQHWNDMFADIGTRQRAYYMIKKYKQYLHEVAPEETQAIDEIVEKYAGLLENAESLSARERRDLIRVLKQDAYVGPDEVLVHDVPITKAQANKALHRINKELDRMTDIYSPHKNMIRTGVLDGSAFKNTTKFIDDIAASAREFNLLDLTVQTEQLARFSRQFASVQPENFDEIARNLTYISDLFESIENRVADTRRIAQKRASSLKGVEKEKFHEGSWGQIEKFLDEAKSDIDYMTDLISRQANGEDFAMKWDDVVFEGLSDLEINNAKGWIDDLPMEMKSRLMKVM